MLLLQYKGSSVELCMGCSICIYIIYIYIYIPSAGHLFMLRCMLVILHIVDHDTVTAIMNEIAVVLNAFKGFLNAAR